MLYDYLSPYLGVAALVVHAQSGHLVAQRLMERTMWGPAIACHTDKLQGETRVLQTCCHLLAGWKLVRHEGVGVQMGHSQWHSRQCDR